MSKIDWSVLGTSKQGLAVEGQDDKLVIEAFLDIGEKAGYWTDWRSHIVVIDAGAANKVISEVSNGGTRIWGLIDRDWRTDTEVADLESTYPQLLVLPRVTIENYCIAPDDLDSLLPPSQRIPTLKTDIETYRDDWIQNGALWQTLYEQGAFQFCRGHGHGYPMALLHQPVLIEADIEARFQAWHGQLETTAILPIYRHKITNFRANKSLNYFSHIHGKNFFRQVIVQKVLNPHLGQRAESDWFRDLFSNVLNCPDDIVPVLQKVML